MVKDDVISYKNTVSENGNILYIALTTLPLVVSDSVALPPWGGKCPEMGVCQKKPTQPSAIEHGCKVLKAIVRGGFFAYVELRTFLICTSSFIFDIIRVPFLFFMKTLDRSNTMARQELTITTTGDFSELINRLQRLRLPKMTKLHIWFDTEEMPSKKNMKSVKRIRKSIKDTPAFGMWAGREDMEDVSSYVRELRKSRSLG